MNAIIIEDEELAAERLAHLLSEVAPEIQIEAQLRSVKSAVDWLSRHTTDLIFLDVQLSDGLSFSIFEKVQVKTPVILTTAFDQYAIKAFELNSVAYLLKPVRKTELRESLRKLDSLRKAYTIDFEDLQQRLQGHSAYRKRFLLQVGETLRKVETQDIAYFFSAHKSSFLRTFDGHTYDLDLSLEALQQSLDPERFFRINRQYIISMPAIQKMVVWSRKRLKIELSPPAGDHSTIVSVDRAKAFREWLDH